MTRMIVEVETYAGFKADERPLRFRLKGREYEVVSVLERGYGPDDSWFKVEAGDGGIYVLRQRQASGEWTLECCQPSRAPGSWR